MIGKPRCVIDFDNTITSSSKTIIDKYSIINKKTPIYNDSLLQWNFSPFVNTKESIQWAINSFEEQWFWDELEFVEPTTKEVLQRLSENWELVIVTKKSAMMMEMNSVWIRNNLDGIIDRVIYLEQDDFCKDMISSKVCIDDKIECMLGVKSDFKLLYGNYGYQVVDYEKYKEHKDLCKILRINKWLDIEKLLNSLN